MPNYFYNPCAPCCLTCGWGPYEFLSQSDNPFTNQFQQTDFNGSPTWSISGNRLQMTGGSGSLWRASPYPDPTGKAASGHSWATGAATVQAVCWKNASAQQSGVFIGGGRVFYADWVQQAFFYSACDSTGHATGNATKIPGTPTDGVLITLCVQKLAAGTTSFNTSYSINGNVAATETGVSPSALGSGSEFNSGFWATQASTFGTSSMVCGTSCPTTSSCNICPGGIAQCWDLNVTGISAAQFDGNFCLRTAGCTIVDQNALWTVSVGSSTSTLIAATGSTTFANYSLSGTFACNGSNAFTFVSATAGTGWPTTITISPTNCSAPPCVPVTNCGQCSWPTQWLCTIGGVSTAGGCPPSPQVGLPNGPLESGTPPSPPASPYWPYNGDCQVGTILTCEEFYNATFTLSGGGGAWGGAEIRAGRGTGALKAAFV